MNELRALLAVQLLTRIRKERPELWSQIVQFARPYEVDSHLRGVMCTRQECRHETDVRKGESL